MADFKAPTKRKTITLTVATLRRLDQLALGGWFGSDAAGIATNFIEEGLRAARDKGHFNKAGGSIAKRGRERR